MAGTGLEDAVGLHHGPGEVRIETGGGSGLIFDRGQRLGIDPLGSQCHNQRGFEMGSVAGNARSFDQTFCD